MKWSPPSSRPPNESAGYLGYYCRTFLDLHFDLVDIDGTDPVQWFYWKQATGTLRFIEEKPLEGNWQLHASQERTLRKQATLINLGIAAQVVNGYSGVYVIQGASQLVEPRFPITVRRMAEKPSDDETMTMDRSQFDKWMLLD